MKQLLTIDEAAEYLRVTPATIYRWCRAGRLPALKIGKQWRVSASDLRDWLEQQKDQEPEVVAFGRTPEHVLGLVSSPDQAPRFVLHFLRRARLAGARLVYASLQSSREFLGQAKAAGIDTSTLESQGHLVVADLGDRSGQYSLPELRGYWRAVTIQTSGLPTWLVTSCFGPADEFDRLMDAERDLDGLVKEAPLLSVCIFRHDILPPAHLLELARLHAATMLFDPVQPLFLRQTLVV
ncbi:MAG TPA: hypothetical protein DCM14_07515 [Clostridiales bacterium UBA8153]|nr:hypothetical protein [Clostridiales bacterium UBA8153]